MAVRIFQISYNDEVAARRDPAFGVYDCRRDPAPDKREMHHMHAFWRAGHTGLADYTGLVSPKFGEKAKMDGAAFIRFVEENPGHDAYFINPYPQFATLSFNVWEHGEHFQPGMGAITDDLLRAAGHRFCTGDIGRNAANTLLYCNFWVGNRRFWDRFMGFVEPMMAAIEANETLKARILRPTSHYTPAVFYPFVFERMFSTFLLLDAQVSALAFPHTRAGVLLYSQHEMESLLVQRFSDMVERWDAEGVYGIDRRETFRGLLEASQLFMVAKARIATLAHQLRAKGAAG